MPHSYLDHREPPNAQLWTCIALLVLPAIQAILTLTRHLFIRLPRCVASLSSADLLFTYLAYHTTGQSRRLTSHTMESEPYHTPLCVCALAAQWPWLCGAANAIYRTIPRLVHTEPGGVTFYTTNLLAYLLTDCATIFGITVTTESRTWFTVWPHAVRDAEAYSK